MPLKQRKPLDRCQSKGRNKKYRKENGLLSFPCRFTMSMEQETHYKTTEVKTI